MKKTQSVNIVQIGDVNRDFAPGWTHLGSGGRLDIAAKLHPHWRPESQLADRCPFSMPFISRLKEASLRTSGDARTGATRSEQRHVSFGRK